MCYDLNLFVVLFLLFHYVRLMDQCTMTCVSMLSHYLVPFLFTKMSKSETSSSSDGEQFFEIITKGLN
jgi:hypothetical protein